MYYFYLIFKGDIIFISLLVIMYLVYAYVRKLKSNAILKYSLVFIFSFYWLFFCINCWFTPEESRGIAKLSIIPLLAIYYLYIPIQKNRHSRKAAIILLIGYVLFWLIIIALHYFSKM